MKKKNIW